MRGLRRYAAVMAAPHVSGLVTSSLISRAPIGLEALALVLTMRELGWSYGAAGGVAAALAVGVALAGPLAARVVDRLGARRVIVPLALLHAAAIGAFVVLGESGARPLLLAPLAALSGASFPPVAGVLRTIWPDLLGERHDLLAAAYALDSVLVELTFTLGPLLVALLAAISEPQWALIASGALVVGGSIAFVLAEPVRGYAPGVSHGHDTGGWLGALRSPGVRTLALVMVPIGFCIGAIEITFPAFGEDVGSRALGGPLLAVWSAGSGIGGLIYGARASAQAPARAFVALTAALPLVTLPLAIGSSFATMVPLAVLAGLAIAPLITATNQLIGDIAPRGALTEAYIWPLTALVAGVALGNGASGAIIEHASWRAALVVAAAVAGTGILIAHARRATLTVPQAAVSLPTA
ncbi:MAG: MFS transporter [Solirubrobacteraceae bacterium]|nr:MFS transporter [Solirubrobacteraceae bacterium]